MLLKVEKLLLSAIANWQSKNEGARIEESNLVVKEAYVDQSKTLKRIQPAPQGQGTQDQEAFEPRYRCDRKPECDRRTSSSRRNRKSSIDGTKSKSDR